MSDRDLHAASASPVNAPLAKAAEGGRAPGLQQPGPPRRGRGQRHPGGGGRRRPGHGRGRAAAKRDWARTPMHERGAVLLRAAANVEAQAAGMGP